MRIKKIYKGSSDITANFARVYRGSELIWEKETVPSKALVRFIDYDGTILKQESVDIGGSATPPELPDYSLATATRPALTFQGWNRDFTNITEDRDIGATYIPTDGKTHAFVRLTEASGKKISLYLNKTDTSTLSIDWGDNITTTHTGKGDFDTSHTYSDYGDYEIKIWVSSGNVPYSLGNSALHAVFIGGELYIQRDMLMYLFVGNNVSSIRGFAISDFPSLTSIVISDSVTSIEAHAFNGCSSLTSIVIPDSVTFMEMGAFRNCSSLTSIVIPDSITSIVADMVSNCTSLTSIIIPNSVTSIRGSAFSGCSSLTSISIPDSVTSIGNYAFYKCSNLTSISIPNSVTSLGSSVFSSCSSLTSISIPDSVTSIGDTAFSGCSSLTSITIPLSVTSIGSGIIDNCTNLTDVYFAGTTETWIERFGTEGMIFYFADSNKTTVIVQCSNGDVAYEFPSFEGG